MLGFNVNFHFTSVGLGLKIPVNYDLWRCNSYNMGEKYLGNIK